MNTVPEKSKGLGRGLAALLGEGTGVAEGALSRAAGLRRVPIDLLRPNPNQPRRVFDQGELEALAESIRAQGLLQPILVRPDPNAPEAYQIVAGERRWRAAQKTPLHEVPILVLHLSDRDTLQVALVENLQRTDLNPLEEAEAYRRLIDDYGNSQEAVASAVGKSRSHIANMIRLLELPDPVKQLIDERKLAMGHARALIGTPDPLKLAREIVAKNLNARQAEELAKRAHSPRAPRAPHIKDPDLVDLERQISSKLGLAVTIKVHSEGGQVVIAYKTLDQLDDLLKRLTQPVRSIGLVSSD